MIKSKYDLVIGSNIIEDHIETLEKASKLITEYGIKLRLDKCHFAQE